MLKEILKRFWPKEKEPPRPKFVSTRELERKRADAFDRWTWETGSKADREEFEKLDKVVKGRKNERERLRTQLKIYNGMLEHAKKKPPGDPANEIITVETIEKVLEKTKDEYKQKFEDMPS